MNNQVLFGIDKIDFYTSNYYLDLKALAAARGIQRERFYSELGQHKMAICPPGEDIVTMGAGAAAKLLGDGADSDIDLLLFATESGIDASKAAGIYVHSLLGLPAHCRVIELKQACYAATGGLQLAISYLHQFPDRKVLLIAADIARYKMHGGAESSQGCGAVALLCSANPRVLAIEPESGFYTKDVMDFWRPNYCAEAFVDGRLSCDVYLRLLEECWREYQKKSGRKFLDHDCFCYHTPVPKLVERAHLRLAKINGYKNFADENIDRFLENSLQYNREIGNCYTASLYLGITSLLENNAENMVGKRIGLYSYGSGSVGEYFSGVVQKSYRDVLQAVEHQNFLQQRTELTYQQYEEIYNFTLPQIDGVYPLATNYRVDKFRLAAIENHKRIYEKSS